ncbi:AIR synthase-related protein [Spirosoma sp. KUDC1026]|uniref:AIR synthase-related protein n=1 Tax=Spirosoma sp. KUDC1026 TaxID=2745947 RepID=UPI00159BA3CD|nr:AIR synthase-related protein [Spirosoma sp. KUDC1026]QKZ13456.1 phosphoribosylformylglycinamidine synthase subunit PurL [Spirosoma sp. KUDC1026]
MATFSTPETNRDLGLLPEEFERIEQILGRQPNPTEQKIFSAVWSQDRSNKKFSFWINQLPRDSDRMLVDGENAGLIDIGDGLAAAINIGSRNQPSSRDVVGNREVGGQPVARLNSLYVGDLEQDETRALLRDVMKGAGTASGNPVMGGEIFFDTSYNRNSLTSVFSASIVEVSKVAKAKAFGAGSPVFIIGSATAEGLPNETTHEIRTTDHAIGIQTIGAAGLIGAIAELSAKSEHGITINLDNVPTLPSGSTPVEILLSELRGQLLVVVEKGNEAAVQGIADTWNLTCAQLGEVADSGETGTASLLVYHHGERVADVPTQELVKGGSVPQDQQEYREPAYIAEYATFDIEDVDDLKLDEVKEVAKHLLAHPNISARQWLHGQYSSVGNSTYARSDAAIVRVQEAATEVAGASATETSIVLTVNGNSRYVYASPRQGTMIALVEAARNIVCSGGDPLAVTSQLTFGSPDVPEEYWQFVEAVQGLGEACRRFSTPATGSTVSFSSDSSRFPTATIGMLGLMEDPGHRMTLSFKNEGDRIYLIGPTTDDIASSEYLYSYRDVKASPTPFFDFQTEWRVQEGIRTMIRNGWIQSAHDVSGGGLFVTLAESAMAGEKGFAIESNERYRMDAFLFGEGQSRVVVTVSPEHFHHVEAYLDEGYNVFTRLGSVTAADFVVDETVIMTSAEARELYDNTLEKRMKTD